MNTKALPGVVISLFVLVIGLLYFSSKVSITNQEQQLRNRAAAQQQANAVRFDNTWKIISQQGQVAEKYKDSFREVYTGLMEGRYKNGEAQMAKFVNEANPNFDPSLYKQLNDTIRGERLSFEESQKQLLAIKQEHDNLRTTWPGSMYVGNVAPLDVKIVTSSATEETFRTGHEDNVNVFGGK